MTIPFLDLQGEYAAHKPAIDAAIARVLAHGTFILGPEVKELETQLAALTGQQHGVGVASGTDALILALRALGLGPGDEIITTPLTFVATAEAIVAVGATPVFADVDPQTLNLNPRQAAAAITGKTKAIIVVHLYGQPCDMTAFTALAREQNLNLIEDCAHAFGASWRGTPAGGFGDAACHSFFPSKVLGAYGDGGMVCVRDAAVAELLRTLRAHGSRKKYHPEIVGYNSRLDTLQAAILLAKLTWHDAALRGRRQVAAWYRELLAGTAAQFIPDADGAVNSCYALTVRVPQRDTVAAKLKEQNIPSMVYYPVPLHRVPVYAGSRTYTLQHAEQAAADVLSLPVFPSMTRDQVAAVADALRAALA